MEQIVVKHVTKLYTVGNDIFSAVRNVSLTINEGDFISIVGHSGSGKTTLLSLIGGITAPTSGSILFSGTDIGSAGSDALAEYRNGRVGFMFQFASLLPMLTILENLMLPAVFADQRAARTGVRTRAEELLAMVGLSDKVASFPSQLSGGQQRRVAIARAFMNKPRLILADEPTGDLDEATEEEMMRFFMSMNRSLRITFVMVTHNTDLARQANQQFVMHEGELRERYAQLPADART